MDSKVHLQKLVSLNLDYVANELFPLIDNDFARVSAQEVIERVKASVVALTDEDGADKAQLAQIWGSISSDPEMVEAVRKALNEAISKIDEPVIAQGLSTLVLPLTKTIMAVTDNVKPDGAQLKQIWKDYLESPEFMAFVFSNLNWIISKVVKDEKAQAWIMKLLNAFIK
jgi:hypothetical protein